MTNVEMLKEMGKLGAVRQRLGADNKQDDSCDVEINSFNPQEVVETYCAWHLGDRGEWARDFIEMYVKLVNKGS